MFSLRATFLGLLLSGLIAVQTTAPAWADQNDPRLMTLFKNLSDDIDASDAARITDEIWAIWHENEDSDVQSRFDDGLRFMREGNLDKAVAEFGHVISLAPEFAEAWNKRATVHYMMGDTRLSAADVRKTLELEPRHFGALSGLGLLYGQHDKIGAAIKAFEEALAVNPHLSGAQRNLDALRAEFKRRQDAGEPTGKSI